MSRFSKLIDQLEDLDQQDIKNTARVFAITAELYQKLQNTVESQPSTAQNSLAPDQITQESVLQRYGNYDKAYQAYRNAYGIKCKRGWRNLLPLIKELPMPLSIEERLAYLEDKVQLLAAVLKEMVDKK